jgi:hypothetical protein
MSDDHTEVWRGEGFAFVEPGKDQRFARLQGISIGQLEYLPHHPMEIDVPIHDVAGDVGGGWEKALSSVFEMSETSCGTRFPEVTRWLNTVRGTHQQPAGGWGFPHQLFLIPSARFL